MGLVMFMVRLVLTLLAIGFAGWVGYIISLGFKNFFEKKEKVNKK